MSMNAVPSDTPPLAGGGEPPYDKGMDRRLTVLETRFDTILPTLATKAGIEVLRAEVHVGFEKLRGETEKLRGVSLSIGVLAVNISMFNAINGRLMSIATKFSATQQSSLPAHPPVGALRPYGNAQ